LTTALNLLTQRSHSTQWRKQFRHDLNGYQIG
jgi:hypothetical protein